VIYITKKDLREKYLKKRNNISFEERKILSEKIFNNYISKFKPFKGQNIHIFLPILDKSEVITDLWINFFWENNICVFIPKVKGTKIISIKYTYDTKLIRNKWNILEPETNYEENNLNFSQIITPLIYADIFGNRIGYGRGFYDRFFSYINQSAKKIGLGFFTPKEIISDIEKSDVTLDHLILPKEILSFPEKTSNFTK